MADLARGSGGPPSRRGREQRAYRLVVTGGVAGTLAVVGAVLALVGAIGWFWPFVAVVVAIVCVLMFRRTVAP